MSLDVWSAKVCKAQSIREEKRLKVVRQGQQTHRISVPISSTDAGLGLTLQLSPLSSTQNIWHILSIPSPLSPAFQAGLLPHSDYILGTPSGTLRGESAFGELVEDHLNRSLVLWVYNSEFDVVREVELVPRRGWGGEGALGAVLGYGALHRLPVGLGEEIQGPGESLFEAPVNESENQYAYAAQPAQFLSPMNDAATSIPPPPFVSPSGPPKTTSPAPARQTRKQRNYAAAPAAKVFDDYFAEGEQKSKEEDFAPSSKSAAVPPPPKAEAPQSNDPPPETKSPPPID